jgi:peptidyl-tRNA hydrolase, PTH2 family
MVKQVIVLRKDLNMRKGKMCAQAAHASLKVFFDRVMPSRILSKKKESGVLAFGWNIWNQAELDWFNEGFTKICVGVDSEEELVAVYEKAKEAGILCTMVTDAGKTEFGGVPTRTAVAIGPDTEERIDPITGHLKLL